MKSVCQGLLIDVHYVSYLWPRAKLVILGKKLLIPAYSRLHGMSNYEP